MTQSVGQRIFAFTMNTKVYFKANNQVSIGTFSIDLGLKTAHTRIVCEKLNTKEICRNLHQLSNSRPSQCNFHGTFSRTGLSSLT